MFLQKSVFEIRKILPKLVADSTAIISRLKDTVIDKNDCYSDGQLANFRRLDNSFTNCLFILNTRKLYDWLFSLVEHFALSEYKSLFVRQYVSFVKIECIHVE